MTGSWAVLITAVLVVSGPAVSARPAGTPTTILVGVVADAPPTRAGDSITAFGVIESGGSPLAGAAVQLQERVYGASTFSTVGTATSNASGQFSAVSPALVHNATFRWYFPADGGHDTATSATWFVRVSPRVGIRVSDRTPATGQRIVVRGHTHPAKSGNRVSVWRGTKPFEGFGPVTKHTRLVRGHVRADGSYRLVIRFYATGKRRIYVRVGRGGGNAAGYSAYRRLTVH
jgi:hypothetical protein